MLIAGLTAFTVLDVLVGANTSTQIMPTLIYNYGVDSTNPPEAAAMSAIFAAFLILVIVGFGSVLLRRASNGR